MPLNFHNSPNMMYETRPNIFYDAKTFAVKKDILNEWNYYFNALLQHNKIPGCTNSANQNSIKLVSKSYTENIFEINDYQIIDEIINYFTQNNIVVHEIMVQEFKQFPTKPCLEHEVNTFTRIFKLEIICDLINPHFKLDLNKIFLYVIPGYFENKQYQNITFYHLAKAQRSRPKKLQLFEAVYNNNNPYEFIGVMRFDEDFLNFRSLIETCKNYYNKSFNEFNNSLTKQKKQLKSIDFQYEVMRLNACVDWFELTSLSNDKME